MEEDMEIKEYYLDPDFRIGNKMSYADFCKVERCKRCEKPLKSTKVPVTVNWDTWTFVDGHVSQADIDIWKDADKSAIDNGFLGSDCYKLQTKETI